MSDKGQQAKALYQQGYNCAQAVFLAFCADTGIDEQTGARLTNCLGGGFSRTGGLCGAVSAGGLVISAHFGRETPEPSQRQEKTFRLVKEFHSDFKTEFSEVACPMLMKYGLDASGISKNPKHLCPTYVQRAAELVEAALNETSGESD